MDIVVGDDGIFSSHTHASPGTALVGATDYTTDFTAHFIIRT